MATRAKAQSAPGDIVSGAVLGEFLGLSQVSLREMAAAGVVVKAGRGHYELKASVRNYCTKMRLAVTGRAGGEKVAATAAAERARLAAAQASHVELKNAKARGELVEASAVEAEWSGVLRTVRAGILAMPSRCAARLPHLTPHDIGVLVQ